MTSPTTPARQRNTPLDSDELAAVEVPIGAVTDAGVVVSVDLTGATTPAGQVVYDAVVLRVGTSAAPVSIGSVNAVIELLESAREHVHHTGAIA